MSRRYILLTAFLILLLSSASGQQYSAKGYWMMERDSTYLSLLNRQTAGEVLTQYDQTRLEEYKTNLAVYFNQMPDEEKALYYKNRAGWSKTPGSVLQEDEQVFVGERSTFTKYVAASSAYGFMYGAAGIYILGITSEAAVGLPFITGGISAIIPIATIKDKMVSPNSLLLSLHGKAIGAFQGAMLGVAIVGNNNSDEDLGKLVAGLATASSITFGHVGFKMGKNSNWTPGRITFYTHYGWLIPIESMALVGAFGVEDARIYGITSLLGGAGGYLLAKGVVDRNNYTRGDVFSIQTFTWLNGLLGLGILADLNEPGSASILIPAATTMAGTLAGQLWMKNAKLSSQQGRNIILGTSAGSVIGFGISAMISIDEISTINYVIPYITGLISYSLIAESYKKKNNSRLLSNEKSTGWKFNLMPQNIIINNRMASSGRTLPGNRMSLLPAFSASVVF
jgi:hypothetical protein